MRRLTLRGPHLDKNRHTTPQDVLFSLPVDIATDGYKPGMQVSFTTEAYLPAPDMTIVVVLGKLHERATIHWQGKSLPGQELVVGEAMCLAGDDMTPGAGTIVTIDRILDGPFGVILECHLETS
jgi:hypothetical protein